MIPLHFRVNCGFSRTRHVLRRGPTVCAAILCRRGTQQKLTDHMSQTSTAAEEGIHLTGQEGVPKYLLLRNALALEMTPGGRWAPGTRLPPEDVLASMCSLSLGTVQRSLRMLVDEGRLVRRHGIGTFVAELETPLGGPFQHFRFLDEDSGRILPIFTRVVGRTQTREPGSWTPLLKTASAVCIDRLFSINNEFNVYVRLYFDGKRFPDLARVEKSKLNGVSFKDLIAREYHQPTARYDQTLRVIAFPQEVCAALGAKQKMSGGLLELIARDRAGAAIYFQEVYIPANNRRLMIAP